MNNRFVYLDHAVTTAMRPEVYEAMQPYFIERYGNPSSIYSFARDGKKATEGARDKAAGALGARAEEIFFTGSGNVSINVAEWTQITTVIRRKTASWLKSVIAMFVEKTVVIYTSLRKLNKFIGRRYLFWNNQIHW
ncbi:aminotransferase class V-fold PLP-dependent enzyme [Anaerocolumna jejuensis]|uniref:aminotransferase class V-fold PLP-dependent enzyme n=1 Tax=Anaerocolumna jejuensis TaxID=259063 RepID=UPI003F7BF9B4